MNRMDQFDRLRQGKDSTTTTQAETPGPIQSETLHDATPFADDNQAAAHSPVHESPIQASPIGSPRRDSAGASEIHSISDDARESSPAPPPPVPPQPAPSMFERNPFESHPDIASYYQGRRDGDPVDDYLLPRNPLARIIDETAKIGEANITSRLVSLCDDTRNLEGYQAR